MRYYLFFAALLFTVTAYGQADPAARTRADSIYNAEMREITQKKRNQEMADSAALAKYRSTLKETPAGIINQDLSSIDAKNGFRDLKFGVAVSQVRGLVPYGKAVHGEQTYIRPTDSKKVGDAILSGIFYVFYKGRFESVILETKGYINSQSVLKALKSLYGTPSQPNRLIKDYQWFGSRAIASFRQNSITENATAYIISIPISNQMKADREAAAKKATSDL